MSIEGFNGEENYYPYPTSNNHKGEVMERREQWSYVETTYSAHVYCGSDNMVVRPHWTGAIDAETVRATMRMIADDHNQHTALIEQRDLLVEALRNLIRQLPNDERLADYNLDKAEHALATVEQGEGA